MYLQFEVARSPRLSSLICHYDYQICFAIYGPPSDDAEELETAYNSDQRAFATKIYDKIRETYLKAPERRFQLGFIFIFCKEGDKEYQVPLFRLLWQKNDYRDDVRYIDTACRVYENAQDWKDNNCLPMMKYCFPERLYYTCNTGGAYEFDPERQTDVGFGTSPACDLLARIGRIADVTISVVAATVGVVTIFTPVGFVSAPILLGVAGTSTGYGVGRAAQRLIDKVNHGESITDLEGAVLILSIVAAPLHMLTGFVSARLAAGAASGRIFSQSQRILATILMFTAVGVDSFSFILNISNLVDKLRNDSLTFGDVLQFSVSTLFFTNTLIQPKTAWGVIERAQQQRITAIANNMTDEQAKKAFQSYLEQNKGDGSIKDTSKIVRNLNHMEDPSYFFKSVNDMESIKIAGRKGRTLHLTDKSGRTLQANPNNRIAYSTQQQWGLAKIHKQGKLRACLNGDYETHKYLRNSTERQIGRINKIKMRANDQVFGGAAGYSRDIVEYAERLAHRIGVKDPDRFMSLVEVVAAEVKGNQKFNFNDNATFNEFQGRIEMELPIIKKLAASRNLKFADEYKALYHYRKHGAEFMELCSPQFYLGDLPQDILKNAKLTDVCNVTSVAQDGSKEIFTRKTYYTSDDRLIVLLEKDGLTTISTMFRKQGGWQEFMDRFRYTNTPSVEIAMQNYVRSLGLNAIGARLQTDNIAWNNEKCRRMMAMLLTYHSDYMEFDQDD
ncbi:hypothetical protein OSTOST_04559 [Ostertagia ostertagi]